jgi:hypothetical protein
MGVMSVRRLSLATLVSLCAFAGSVSFSVSVALAVTPPVVEETDVLDVAGTSTTLQARINPQGNETTYRFEYGTSEAYGSGIPVPDGLVGSGSVGVLVSAHLQDLLPGTTYHYRVAALVASRGETVAGGDGTFTTQSAGGEFALPDGRQWELASPPSKHGAVIEPLSITGGLIQASEDGDGITYRTNLPTELEPSGYDVLTQILSRRGAQGWSTRDIAVPHTTATGIGPPPEYQFFTGDLSSALAFPYGGAYGRGEDPTLLSSQASERTPYIRREGLCDAPASANECYLPLLTGKEGFADVPPGTKFGGEVSGRGSIVSFVGASPDLHHVLLSSLVALTATPIPTIENTSSELYEWSAGGPASSALQLVSVLPESEGGGPATGSIISAGPHPASEWSATRHSVSDDGSRIFWTTQNRLYVRDTVRKETVRLDAQRPDVPNGGTPSALFQFASSDGSKVFFTDYDQEQRLTAQSGTQGQDLYECEIIEEAGKLKCNLTDLTPESGGQSAEMQGMPLGASEDGSYVYFVANGALAEGATQGTCEINAPSSAMCNLYEYHNHVTTFIATLSVDDQHNWFGGALNVGTITARVSPGGRYVAFMSDRSLTGYDNRDASSGKPDMEVYLYDAVGSHLTCASCNPTGSRPTGVEVADFTSFGKNPRRNLVDVFSGFGGAYGPENWVAANLPGGSNIGPYGESLYQPRLLSDSGRLFFNSSDVLVSQDVNGQEDVYQFEPRGVSGCTVSSVTFNAKSDGCVGLISSGTSPEESGFLDASKGGGDAFFLTASRLTSQDYDTAFDIYDAHECSVAVACVAPPAPPPPCNSGDSCKAAPSSQPSIFGAPASATFNGAGNVAGSPSTSGVKPRSSTRARKLAAALRSCHKKPKRKRPACERQARKRNGAKAARKTAVAIGKVQG